MRRRSRGSWGAGPAGKFRSSGSDAGARRAHAGRRLSLPEREASREGRALLECLGEPLGHRRPMLEAVARAAAHQPYARMRRVRTRDEVRIRGELVAARACLDERSALERGEAVAQVRANLRFRGCFVGELAVRVERRSEVVDRGLEPQFVDIGCAVSGEVVVTPTWQTGGAPCGDTV